MALLAIQLTASAINPVLVGPGPGLVWLPSVIPSEDLTSPGDFTSADAGADNTIGLDGGGF